VSRAPGAELHLRLGARALIALQLNPPLFVVTPKGDGIARILIDYGPDTNPMFIVELNESRDILCFDMLDIKGSGNSAWGLSHPEPFESRA
jgi:hypothetical protein